MSTNASKPANRSKVSTPGGTAAQHVVLVAVCTGQRCAALRRLDSANRECTDRIEPADNTPDGGDRSQSEQKLRGAIRARPEAVLVSVPCLGPCNRGSITAVGAGLAGPSRLTWLGRPTLIGTSETPARADILAGWITGAAPDVATLPRELRHD